MEAGGGLRLRRTRTYALQGPLVIIRNPSRIAWTELDERALLLRIRAEYCLLMLWPQYGQSCGACCQGGRQDGCVLHLAGVLVRLFPMWGRIR